VVAACVFLFEGDNADGVLAGVCSGDLMGERHGTCETVTTPSLCRDKAYSSRSSSF